MASNFIEFETSNRYITGKIAWSSSPNNISNTSSVTAILYYKKSSQSTEPTYGTFKGNLDINGTKKSISKSITLNCNNTYIEVDRLTVPSIQHNDDGKKTITISAEGFIPGTSLSKSSGSTEAVLDTIPRESKINTFSDFVIGENFKIELIKYSSSFTDNLQIKYGNTVIKTINNYQSKTEISFSQNELNTIYNLMNTVNEGTITAIITTKSGSTTIGTNSKTAKGSLKDCNPTFVASNVTYYDNNNTITAITQNNQHIVQNLSNLIVSISAATGKKGATISKYVAKLNGVEKQRATAGTVNFNTINSSTDLSLEVTAVDSRGNTTTVNKTITILEWSLPKAEIDLKRLNNFEDESYLTVKANFSSVNNKNTINIKYKYSLNDDYTALKENLLEGDAVGLRNMDVDNSTISCDVPANELSSLISNMKNGKEIARFSQDNYISEEIDENYYEIKAHFVPNSLNHYSTEFVLFRYDTYTQQVVYNEELPGYYLNDDIVQSVSKKAASYKYIFLNSIPKTYNTQNNELNTIICSKDRVWYFQIEIKDKFSTVTYNVKLPKGKPIFYIDILNLAVGVNCFPKGEGGIWTDEEWEDIKLEPLYYSQNNYFSPQYKKKTDRIVFRGVISSEGAFNINVKIGEINYRPSKKVVINAVDAVIEIRTDGGIYLLSTNSYINNLYLDGLSFFIE